ncbi:catalase [Fusarium mexicanum]|uniref:Catalase n=1 Tax=Fusarium mexicanum TaxID=751941 RepID=A0A8H5N9G6_9HYPO|nr:catalase [Fusarium mexicanum]
MARSKLKGWAYPGGGRWPERVELSSSSGYIWYAIPIENLLPKHKFAWAPSVAKSRATTKAGLNSICHRVKIYSVNAERVATRKRLRKFDEHGQGFSPITIPTEFVPMSLKEYEKEVANVERRDLGHAQAISRLSQEDAVRLAGDEPGYHVKNIYHSVERGGYPTWTMYLLVMNHKEAETYKWNIFNIAKIWPHKYYPLPPVGKLVLNKNPDNHSHDIEQAAFSSSVLIPGIASSAGIMLHARMFSYPDAARYCVGPNYQQHLCNRPLDAYSPYQRDGPMRLGGNQVRSYFRKVKSGHADVVHSEWVGKVPAYPSDVEEED